MARIPDEQIERLKAEISLQRLGLIRSSGHEHFRGSLVIPILDAQGNVLEVYGRKLTNKVRPGTPLSKPSKQAKKSSCVNRSSMR